MFGASDVHACMHACMPGYMEQKGNMAMDKGPKDQKDQREGGTNIGQGAQCDNKQGAVTHTTCGRPFARPCSL